MSEKVESTVRTANADARDFIRSSVLAVWENPFPEYVAPLSNKERNRRNREARGLATSTPSTTTTTTTAPPAPPQPETRKAERKVINHFVMNLPASAIEFLDAYRGLYRDLYAKYGDVAREEVKRVGLPIVHCYCFTKDIEGAEKDICEVRLSLSFSLIFPFDRSNYSRLDYQRATRALGFEVHPQLEDYNLRFVRDVAPKKEMYCLEFRLTEEMTI